jgi:hypothetical protein
VAPTPCSFQRGLKRKSLTLIKKLRKAVRGCARRLAAPRARWETRRR